MKYKRIYYWESRIFEYPFEYMVDFEMKQGEIYYQNSQGGFTKRGIDLPEAILKHFQMILDKGKLEQYRDENLETENAYMTMETFSWNLDIQYLDGKSRLRIDDSQEEMLSLKKDEIFKIPSFVTEMRKYAILKLGLSDYGGKSPKDKLVKTF